MYADDEVTFQNCIKQEKSGLISQCDERERESMSKCTCVSEKMIFEKLSFEVQQNFTANSLQNGVK